jgi:hypothetical protein
MRRLLFTTALAASLLAAPAQALAKGVIVTHAAACGAGGCRAVTGPGAAHAIGQAVLRSEGENGGRPQASPPLQPFYRLVTRPMFQRPPMFVLADGRTAYMNGRWITLGPTAGDAVRTAIAGLPPVRPSGARAWIGTRRLRDPAAEVALLRLTTRAHPITIATHRQLAVNLAFDQKTPWTVGPQYPMLAYYPGARVALRDGTTWVAVPAGLDRRLRADAGMIRPATAAAGGGGSGSAAAWVLAPAALLAAAAALVVHRRRGFRKGGAVS